MMRLVYNDADLSARKSFLSDGKNFLLWFKPTFLVVSAFKMIEGDHALPQRFTYIVGNLVCLALAIYKCQVMGLLPTHPSDWLAFIEPQQVSGMTSMV